MSIDTFQKCIRIYNATDKLSIEIRKEKSFLMKDMIDWLANYNSVVDLSSKLMELCDNEKQKQEVVSIVTNNICALIKEYSEFQAKLLNLYYLFMDGKVENLEEISTFFLLDARGQLVAFKQKLDEIENTFISIEEKIKSS